MHPIHFANFDRWVTGIGTAIAFVVVTILISNAPAAAQRSTENGSDSPVANSTFQNRVVANAVASKAGSLIGWRRNVDAALDQSRRSGKPVFWYVPRLPDTFMDRVISIDMYLRAGPFSDPAIIQMLNEHFIPLRAVPRERHQRQFDLKRFRFIEPGFLIVSKDRKVIDRVDRLTTLHLPWLRHGIASAAGISGVTKGDVKAVDAIASNATTSDGDVSPQQRARWRGGDPQSGEVERGKKLQAEMLRAMQLFSSGDHGSAKKLFEQISRNYPNHPLGHKAAAEGQGIGPFVRGFEVQTKLPEAVLSADVSKRFMRAGNVYTQSDLWHRGTDFLLSMQRSDGGFYDSDYDFGGADSLPNVHVAVTALSAMALFEQWKVERNMAAKQRMLDAVIAAASFVADDKNLNFKDRDEIFWALVYRLELWTAIASDRPSIYPERHCRAVVGACVDTLASRQTETGAWYHEYSNPFVTATGALAMAKAAAFTPNAQGPMQKAKRALAKMRFKNGAFPYDEASVPERSESDGLGKRAAVPIASAAGRMPLCEAALFVSGGSAEERLTEAIAASFKFQKHLDAVYKYDNHTNNYDYGGFFFWYDMRGRRQAIDLLPDSSVKKRMLKRLKAIVLSKPEIDGCFVDSHELGRCYGTAMALLTLGQD